MEFDARYPGDVLATLWPFCNSSWQLKNIEVIVTQLHSAQNNQSIFLLMKFHCMKIS